MILRRPRGTEGSRYMCDENRAEGLQVEAGLLLYWIHVRVYGDEKFYRHKEVGKSLYRIEALPGSLEQNCLSTLKQG